MSETGDDRAARGPAASLDDAKRMRLFGHVLVNVGVANLTAGFLWFALTFWIYLETRSVLVTGILGGSYLALIAVVSMLFGSLVDRHRKHAVMSVSSAITLVAFAAAGSLFLAIPEGQLLDTGSPWLWGFVGIILLGVLVEHLRSIALSTTVTLLVPEGRRSRANGLVGMVQGVAFIATSVLSGLAVGLLGMGWSLAIAVAATVLGSIHLCLLHVPESAPAPATRAPLLDVAGSIAAVRAVPGLFALILFSTVNNAVNGVYLALMDPYGLTLFSVEAWGVIFGIVSTGTIVAGLLVARFGLGRRPVRTLVLAIALAGAIGIFFTLRDWPLLYIAGNWLIMAFVTVAEAAEQSTIQRVVPFSHQGRVFGIAFTFEAAAAPLVSFLIAPLAEFAIIPWVASPAGQDATGWLLGDGAGRGIALCFVVANLLATIVALLAFRTRAYRRLSASAAEAEA